MVALSEFRYCYSSPSVLGGLAAGFGHLTAVPLSKECQSDDKDL